MSTITNHTKKKTTHYEEQLAEKVAEYEEWVRDIPKDKRVYVDEAGFTNYLYRKYARPPKGKKVHKSIKGNKYQRTSIVAGQLGQEIIAPLQYSGTMNGDFFEIWFEEHLLPEVSEDAVIILNNASISQKKTTF